MREDRCPIYALAEALLETSALLDQRICWLYEGAFHFPLALGDGWTLALSLESESRLRVSVCRYGRARDTLWASAKDHERLRELVGELSDLPALAAVS